MLSASLRWYGGDRTLNQLEQCLLNAFAGNIPGNRWVVGLAGDLVDLINVYDADLSFLDIVITFLEELLYDVLNVFTYIAGFCQGGCVSNSKRNVEFPGKRFGQKSLT